MTAGEGGRRRRVGIDPLGEERTTAAGGAGASAGGGWTDGGPKPRPAGVALNRRRLPDEGRQVVLDEVAKRSPGGGLHLRRANIPRVPVVGIQHDTGRCVSVPFRSGEVAKCDFRMCSIRNSRFPGFYCGTKCTGTQGLN